MSKRFLAAIIIFILLLNLILLSNTATALTARVVVKFDQDNIEYSLGRNDSTTLIVSGNITCEVDDIIEGYQYIKVYLYAGENNGWDPAVSPSVTRFHESGTQGFNASILIPLDADNRTEVRLVVSGNWYVEPQGEKIPQGSGSVYSDKINITIIRPEPPCIREVYEGDPGGSGSGNSLLQFPNIILLVLIPIGIAITVIVYKKRKGKKYIKKEMKEHL